jgi:hypothetical protein
MKMSHKLPTDSERFECELPRTPLFYCSQHVSWPKPQFKLKDVLVFLVTAASEEFHGKMPYTVPFFCNLEKTIKKVEILMEMPMKAMLFFTTKQKSISRITLEISTAPVLHLCFIQKVGFWLL